MISPMAEKAGALPEKALFKISADGQ